MRDSSMDRPLPVWSIFAVPVYLVGVFAILLFPAAGDWRWPEGWAYTLSVAVICSVGYAVINQRNPRVLRNRMKTKKEGLTDATTKPARSDRWFMPIAGVGFVGALIVPALAHRFGWPKTPVPVSIVGLVVSNAGMIVILVAALQNAFASKILDINQGQVLVDTGLYAHMRHPLYSGYLLWTLATPIALGSWWGLIPAAVLVVALVFRIKSEEEMLVKGMDGYEDYRTRVRYKLIPGIH
jgi:protein-S-isoprenylcysteine O-methyltransferase Ste14